MTAIRRLIALLAVVVTAAALSIGVATTALAANPPPAPGTGWTTVFDDNFTGPAGSAPSYNWMYDTGPGSSFGTGEIETMTNSTSNVYLDGNGNLDITALDNDGSWTSGRVQTTSANVGAPAAASWRSPPRSSSRSGGLGYWPAFWMLGPGQWPENGEIDIMEDVNSLSEVSGTVHCGIDPGGPCNEPDGIGSGLTACSGCQTGYHTYTMILNRTNTSAESITFYLDGNAYFTVTEAQVGTSTWQAAFDHNLSIILDLAMGGGYPNGVCGCTTPTSSTASGGTMSVAYVAAYSTSGGGATLRPGTRADHRVRGSVHRRPERQHRELQPRSGLHVQRDQRAAVDVRHGERHSAGARHVHGYQRRRDGGRHDRGPVLLQRVGRAGLAAAERRRALQPPVRQVSRRYELVHDARDATSDLGL